MLLLATISVDMAIVQPGSARGPGLRPMDGLFDIKGSMTGVIYAWEILFFDRQLMGFHSQGGTKKWMKYNVYS